MTRLTLSGLRTGCGRSGIAAAALLAGAALLVLTAGQAVAESNAPFGVRYVAQSAELRSENVVVGTAEFWNTRNNFMVDIQLDEGYAVGDVQIYAGKVPPTEADPPVTRKGKPIPGKFPCKRELSEMENRALVACSLKEEFDLSWGGEQTRYIAIHGDIVLVLPGGGVAVDAGGFWAYYDAEIGGEDAFFPSAMAPWPNQQWGGWFTTRFYHPRRGQFIDAAVSGLYFQTPTNWGETVPGFDYFPGEEIDLWVGSAYLGSGRAGGKISPLDIMPGRDTADGPVVNMARLLQSLDTDPSQGRIDIPPVVRGCLDMALESLGYVDGIDFSDDAMVEDVIDETIHQCSGVPGVTLVKVSAVDAQANLVAGLNQSGIFRKNVSKTEDWGETKQKLEVMPVYFPALRSDSEPSLCCLDDKSTEVDECADPTAWQPGVGYFEWRLNGDPADAECDPRVDGAACVVTLIDCRAVAKPLLVTYLGKVDIYDDQVNEEFWPGRFSWDVYTAVSRDDGTTWKRMNVSRMADLSSFDLETGEPFPGTSGSPYLKVNDNKILVVWQSKFCKSGNPRYAIDLCDNPDTPEVPALDPSTGEVVCEEYCRGNPDKGTEVCEPDYPGDDDYFVTDIWGVRGQQGSVNYDEIDDVAELGIGEIPYSCLWASRGVVVSQKELDAGTFDSLNRVDDPTTPEDETNIVELGDIIWFKPERITSGRRDVFIPVVGSARGAGFAIAWQEDPSGLRPGKGKGPGEGWSGAISNHKTDIWYTFISYDDFNIVDESFVPGGPGGGDDGIPDGDEGYLDKPGLGRPKALVPFALPVRVTDNDMVNTHTLKVASSSQCVTPPGGTDPVCFPGVVVGQDGNNTFGPLYEDDFASLFCGHPAADPATCCDPNDHAGDPNCEDLKGFFGNLNGTKRYAYMARSIDEIDNATGLYLPGGDGMEDYGYYELRGGTLDLCDLTGANSYMDVLPGTSAHERWFGFTNSAGASKLVCVSSDGRMLDGDVFASRPMLQLQPYTRSDGTKSAWALLAYEESKGLGHPPEGDHDDTDNPVDDIVGDSGQDKPIKQDIGKNMMYHSFDFTQPDLVAPGHMVNLPALCGGLYPTYCDDPKTPDVIETDLQNPTCSCTAGEPVPLYFDYLVDRDGDPTTPPEWLPDQSKFLQYRTEIARRARFLMQSPGKMGATKTLGAIIYKQGQEGQGRPADVFIRRFVKSGTGNPYQFANMECSTYLDETFALPACPNGAGAMPSAVGYNCNVWGEATGDRLCGGVFADPAGGYPRRDHINLTSADIDLAVDAGPVDDTPDDPTDDRYGTNKVLLWSQHDYNLGDESYGLVKADGTACDVLNGEVCPAMYSNARSHRGFIRGDFFVTAYALSPNWAAGRNGNDRYNFYVRRSFDGGQTWTTDPAGSGIYVCPEFRSDPSNPDPDGSGNLPPAAYDATCGTYDPATVPDGELPPLPVGIAATHHLDPMGPTPDGVPAQFISAGAFEPARNVSEIKNNHESSGDPRLGTTPPAYPLDGRSPTLANLCPQGNCAFEEDTYVDNMFFVAWGTVDNEKSTGSTGVKAEGAPLDLFFTRSVDYGDTYLKVPWVIGGVNSNQGYGETVWRYDYLAKGEPEEEGECQLRATSDGSKAYAIYHSMIAAEEDPDEVYTRWYPWKPEESSENDLWFRRLIFWPDAVTTP